jgi:phosphatidylserine decarboxylase
VSPVDGEVGQVGTIAQGRLLQAKGLHYGLEDLLAEEDAAEFQGGEFATLYLSPRDYHRVHMPLTGELRRMRYVPGRLFSVNRAATRWVPRLFARNERVICSFRTELGSMALILVGALLVAGLETVWHGPITPPRGRPLDRHYPSGDAMTLARGAEMGRFNMGSTVILLLPPGSVTWEPTLGEGAKVKMGERIATHRSA